MVNQKLNQSDEIRTGLYRTMFHPHALVSGMEDMANNFARGYYSVPQSLIDSSYSSIRKEAEHTDSIQAFLFYHSYGGGTGGGTSCRTLNKLLYLNYYFKNIFYIPF